MCTDVLNIRLWKTQHALTCACTLPHSHTHSHHLLHWKALGQACKGTPCRFPTQAHPLQPPSQRPGKHLLIFLKSHLLYEPFPSRAPKQTWLLHPWSYHAPWAGISPSEMSIYFLVYTSVFTHEILSILKARALSYVLPFPKAQHT